jgi:tetratricopeptide (TPR) repeat protein
MEEGTNLHFKGRHAESCNAFERAVRFAEASWGHDAAELIEPIVSLAMAVGEPEAGGHARIAEVLELERRALGIVHAQFGKDDPRMSYVLEKTGHTFRRLGKHEEACKRLEKGLEIFTKLHGDVSSTAYRLGILGSLLLEMNRPADALPHCERALRIEETYGQGTSRVAFAAIRLGLCLRGVGRTEEAATKFERALAIVHARRPPESKGENALSRELREWIVEARAKP